MATDSPSAVSPAAAYAARLAARHEEQHRLGRRYTRLSGWRRLLLGALVILAVLSEKEGVLVKVVLIGAPALAIDYLMKRRRQVAASMGRLRWGASFYEQRLACAEERWAGTGEPGTRYLDAEHPAAADLDLFGAGCLFERLAAPCTRLGEDTLAAWLLAPAGAAAVRERQAAVAELRDRLDLREDLAYLAAQVAGTAELPTVARWGQAAPTFDSPALLTVGALLPGLTLAAFLGGLYFSLGVVPILVALGLQIAFAFVMRHPASAVLGPLEDRGYDLAGLARLLARLEQERFTAPRLVRLHAELAGAAARQSARLHRLIRYSPFALFLALRPQWAMALDRWRQSTGPALARWLAALGEIEALCSLAAYSYECPDDPFPEVLDDGARFDAEALGHPLLPRVRCVANDLSLGDGVRLLIVSGSNMAGKSTLLRAAGINVVLALSGAPVRAKRLRLSPLVVGATLRVQDSLQAGRSRFYAEVLRVRRLLEMARGQPPLLFLLDELFQGTNSADRRAGAEAVLRQLVEAGAIGLVTTHDLALTEIADRLGEPAANVHFEDAFEAGEITFDYRMRPGVVRHTNGLALMRAVGIEV